MANLGTRPGEGARLIALLERYGMAAGLDAEQTAVPQGGRFVPGTAPDGRQRDHAMEAVQRFVRAFTYENVPWREAQEAGMLWAPLRKPHENAMDPHWLARQSCTDVEHPELGRSFRYATSKWLATGTSWTVGRRAPLLNALNVRHPKGLEIARRLVAMSDVVAEGFSPGVLDSWGLGYDALRAIKPDIIYVQQSGMGAKGNYGRFRTVGPIANSFSGLSEMSGLPEPAMPAGWGYSYLDWMGAYSFALAILTALFHRARTGEGQWVDASQSEVGLFISGPTILDWSANGRIWSRYGNRSPYKPAAPHNVYPCAGDDRWLTLACFTDAEWRALTEVAGHPEWATDGRFKDLAGRLAHQDALDVLVGDWTKSRDGYEMMLALQRAGVPAGVCQTAGDRCDHDPQLAALSWLTEVTGTKIGRWPLAEVPVKLSESPAYIGGRIDRGAPNYGEDNHYVYGELLGMSPQEIKALAEEGVI